MWDELQEQVALERRQLHRLLEVHRPLVEKCAVSPPNEIEISALAAMLHAFYNGIENILKRTVVELGDTMPKGEFWHKKLLDSVAEPTGQRGSVVPPELRPRLKEYMEFRHFFRHAYVFDLRWDRMKDLVLGCEETLKQFERELDRFFEGEG